MSLYWLYHIKSIIPIIFICKHYITYIGYNNYAFYTNYNWFLLVFRQSSPMTNMARVISIIQLKVHTLVGGGGQHGGFDQIRCPWFNDYRKIKHRNAGPLGPSGYPIVSVLSDRFLFEFHPARFESVDLPLLSDDRIQFDVHCALEDDKVKQFE